MTQREWLLAKSPEKRKEHYLLIYSAYLANEDIGCNEEMAENAAILRALQQLWGLTSADVAAYEAELAHASASMKELIRLCADKPKTSYMH